MPKAKPVTLPTKAEASGDGAADWLDARRQAFLEAAQIVQDKLSWIENGLRYFSNISALEVHSELMDRASNAAERGQHSRERKCNFEKNTEQLAKKTAEILGLETAREKAALLSALDTLGAQSADTKRLDWLNSIWGNVNIKKLQEWDDVRAAIDAAMSQQKQ